jgi:hypothetical protein
MTETCTATWSADDLALFGGAEQIDLSTRRRDGSLRPFVPIWIVTVDGALYVRSYRAHQWNAKLQLTVLLAPRAAVPGLYLHPDHRRRRRRPAMRTEFDV